MDKTCTDSIYIGIIVRSPGLGNLTATQLTEAVQQKNGKQIFILMGKSPSQRSGKRSAVTQVSFYNLTIEKEEG